MIALLSEYDVVVGSRYVVFRDRQEGISKSAPSLWRFLRTGMRYASRIFVARLRHQD